MARTKRPSTGRPYRGGNPYPNLRTRRVAIAEDVPTARLDRSSYVLRTAIFDQALWEAEGIRSLADLAQRMGLSAQTLSHLFTGATPEPTALFMKGALRAFRGLTFNNLFWVEVDEE